MTIRPPSVGKSVLLRSFGLQGFGPEQAAIITTLAPGNGRVTATVFTPAGGSQVVYPFYNQGNSLIPASERPATFGDPPPAGQNTVWRWHPDDLPVDPPVEE